MSLWEKWLKEQKERRETKFIDSQEIKKLKLLRPVSDRISSPFGWREKPKPDFHKGIDFACPVGTEVKCMIGGKVFMAGWQDKNNPSKGYGLRVWQQFLYKGKEFYGWYGHMSELNVVSGQEIHEGQILGLSGNTGSSTGPHLHIGVRMKNASNFYDIDFFTEKEKEDV